MNVAIVTAAHNDYWENEEKGVQKRGDSMGDLPVKWAFPDGNNPAVLPSLMVIGASDFNGIVGTFTAYSTEMTAYAPGVSVWGAKRLYTKDGRKKGANYETMDSGCSYGK